MAVSPRLNLSRRGFLKLSGAAAAAATLGGGLPAGSPAVAAPAAPAGPLVSKFNVCDMCFNKCGLIARVRDGVVEKLDPNPKFLKSRGMLCARGNAGVRQVYDPDRLKYPLLRKGARGEGKWQRLPWDEALDLAASKLKELGEKYTRCGVVFMAGSDMQSTFVSRFAGAFGSYNMLSHESMCLLSGTRAFLDTFGEVPNPDMLYTKYVIMLGANRFESLVTPDSMDLMTALGQGCKLVVLDPRLTKTAALAAEYHPIRPHTDLAFLLALAQVLVSENLYDAEFVRDKCYGLEQLAAHLAPHTPEWAAPITDIPAADIRRLARELGAARPAAMIYPGRRSSNYRDSTQVRRAMAIVNALLGNWDRPGGLTAARQVGLAGGIPFEAPFYENNPEDRLDARAAKLMFDEEGSFKATRDAILAGQPYPAGGFVFYKTNPLATAANRAKTVAMFHKMEFVIGIDSFLTDSAWLADLVLPSQTYLERTDPCSALQGSSACACVVTRDPVIAPMFEAKPVFWMMKELAGRLELGEHFDFTIEEFREAQLKGLADAKEALAVDGVYYNPSKLYGIYEGKIYKTKSHKIELYNERYAEAGLDPLPTWREVAQPAEGQFRLVVGRTATITQSSTQNNSLLREFTPTNSLWIHPEPAGRLGIADGATVTVKSPVGSQQLAARVTAETRPDTVYMHTGFGVLSRGLTRVYGQGASIAELLEDQMDEISGNMAMHETMVTVQKEGA
ncbi:MAG: molybdopterin-dependent oxidoreductase [Deltaproteobacteria bacterium]|nr:molybdopterin-dependent oxidoreductase [Deltaproteobacteria bacterium]